MFLRVVRAKVREGASGRSASTTRRASSPPSRRRKGASSRRSCGRRPSPAPRACDSLTLWESAAHADAYVDSGLYDELLDGADPFLAAATEWKADLSRLHPAQRPPLPDPDGRDVPRGGGAGGARPDGTPGALPPDRRPPRRARAVRGAPEDVRGGRSPPPSSRRRAASRPTSSKGCAASRRRSRSRSGTTRRAP